MHDFKAVYDFVHYMDSYLKIKRENNFRTDLKEINFSLFNAWLPGWRIQEYLIFTIFALMPLVVIYEFYLPLLEKGSDRNIKHLT